ncbi:hypothetical protein [Brevibacillus brevis]|uniref:hypothetical protein n=1 Tax=Brevibacillus brevis TaxID=1393 RepID=UPI000E3A847B|nr:hypothetical protein [Brevibacillus brevis]RED21822.1 hypothetical protein DES34_11887 [Brevibacillus brevis]GEC93061.1 hypothetical protein BBR01nite_53920 [Brevibacillus brevis]VEF92685.1 Uncharacterised protein [Brevibacillus brevis]
MPENLLEQLIRKDKVLTHVRKLIEDVETYCDRDVDLSPEILREKLHGIKNVISMEID